MSHLVNETIVQQSYCHVLAVKVVKTDFSGCSENKQMSEKASVPSQSLCCYLHVFTAYKDFSHQRSAALTVLSLWRFPLLVWSGPGDVDARVPRLMEGKWTPA